MFSIGNVSKKYKTTLHPEPNRSLLSYRYALYLFQLSSSLSLSNFWVHLFFIYHIYYFLNIYLTSRLYTAKENLSGTLHKSVRIYLILGKHVKISKMVVPTFVGVLQTRFSSCLLRYVSLISHSRHATKENILFINIMKGM